MGREVRRVPGNWVHPKDEQGHGIPLYGEDFQTAAAEWKRGYAAWEAGHAAYMAYLKARWPTLYGDQGRGGPSPETMASKEYWEYEGSPPERENRMPYWPEEEKTHVQMYEDTTEGTPISPVMPDIESLAHWLADNGASAFGGMTATYEQWLATCQQGSAPSAAVVPGRGLISGVELSASEPAP